MPNFGTQTRAAVSVRQLNPYERARRKQISDVARDASFDAVWNSVEDSP